MEYTFICKSCGFETKLDENDLLACREIICHRCLQPSGIRSTASAKADAPEWRNGSLSPEQKRAAYYRGSSNAIRVLGAAGTGKTTTLIERALYLLQEVHVPVSDIKILAPSCRAAWDISKRLGEYGVYALHVIGRPSRIIWYRSSRSQPDIVNVSSFHSFCLDLIEDYCGFYFSSEPGCEGWSIEDKNLIDRDDQCTIIGKLRKKLGLSGKTLSALVPEAEELADIFRYISNSMIDVEEYYRRRPPVHAETVDHVKKLAEMYLEYKIENKEIDIDDSLAITAGALRNSLDFRREIPKEYLHLLVDDAQDVTPVEWSIIRSVCPPATLFCTGNDAQGICASEGADFRTIREFDKMFPGSVTFKLNENYRSTPEIAELSNALLAESEFPYETASTVHIAETGRKPELHTFPSEQEEADFVLSSVRGKLKEGVPPGEITMLFRTADHAQVMERTLRTAGIPYRLISGQTFLQKPHVKDFFSVIDALNDIHNEAAWCRFLSLHPGLEKDASTLVRDMRKKLPKDNSESSSYQEYDARTWLSERLALAYPKLAYFVHWAPFSHYTSEQMEKIMEYLTSTGLLRRKYDCWSDRKKDLMMLTRLAEKYEYTTTTDHGMHEIGDRFIKEFKLDSDTVVQRAQQVWPAEFDRNATERLTLATVSAGRIESDYCYLLRVQDYPLGKASTPEEIEEERRVLYVAMTRARKQLILTQTAGRSSIFLTQAMKQKSDAGQSERNLNHGISSDVR